MRKTIVAGNWKLNLGKADTLAMLEALLPQLGTYDDREVVIAPMTPLLTVAKEAVNGSPVVISAQNCNENISGAFTGEWPPELLAELGMSYCIVGHSERRAIFGESDHTIGAKTAAVFRAGIVPIACIGETLEERESGNMLNVVNRQLTAILDATDAADAPKLVIAYEPVWAIGTGVTASPEQAEEVHEAIRATLTERVGAQAAQSIRILYGGSVKPENVDVLMSQPEIDGVLVGGASLKADSFARLVNYK